MSRKPVKHIQKVKDLRARLWPELSEEELWHHKKFNGFTSLPRTMPIVLSIIDDLTKGAPASSTYLELWCRAFPEMYVSLGKPDEHAFHSGFIGQRARRTWMDRIRKLRDLGFIYVAAGSAGELSHSVIINPHVALKRLKEKKEPGLSSAKYNALIERANEIGAVDVDHDPTVQSGAGDLDDEIPF
jgi:hypothetical protein